MLNQGAAVRALGCIITDTLFAQRFRWGNERGRQSAGIGRGREMTAGMGIRGKALHAFVACLCAVAVIVSLPAGAVRSAAATSLSDRGSSLHMGPELSTNKAAAKKPCQRGGLVRTGNTCPSGFCLGLDNSAPCIVQVLRKHSRIGPALRSALATQCCGAPLLRPPRIDV